jgi:glycosyltransferase involved in cell wall biosynthesis
MSAPELSVIVPCLNEESTILLLLEALRQQSHPTNKFEVIIADGLSEDGTRNVIAEFQQSHKLPEVILLDNPSRSIPKALNLAIEAARSQTILRLDAHSLPDSDYLEKSLADLETGLGWNVGGLWLIKPGADTWVADSIAIAAAHPFGIGDAKYRYADAAQSVDTVPFGCFKKSLIDKIGSFDETLQSNEDYEFNARIRAAGGLVWFNPGIRSQYFARGNFMDLARQYLRYGYWKFRMLSKFPATIRLRQALPPLFVLGLGLGPFLANIWPVANILWLGAVVSYVAILAFIGIQASLQHRNLRHLFGIPSAIALMHLSYGSAFLWSAIRSFGNKK